MKRRAFLYLVACYTMLVLFFPVHAAQMADAMNGMQMLEDHGSVMMLIDPDTGNIVYANEAACTFYGYAKEQLLSMNISQINTLSQEEVKAERLAALSEQRNYFLFQHKLASGEIRSVEVYSYPTKYGEKEVLYTIVHDISEKVLLEKANQQLHTLLYSGLTFVIVILLLLAGILAKNFKALKERAQEIKRLIAMHKTFIDADTSWIYLKDEHLRYVFVNRAFETFYGKSAEEVIGKDDFAISESAFAQLRRNTDTDTLEKKAITTDTIKWHGKTFRTLKFPVEMPNGATGLGAYVTDITEECSRIRQQERKNRRTAILADALTRSFPTAREQLDYVLKEALKLTESKYGYIYLYDEEKQEFIINSWSQEVMNACKVTDPQTKYALEKTGIWGEAVRQRKAIIANDFAQENPLKKGYPEGHVELTRFMTLPVLIDGQIVAVFGLANRADPYTQEDVDEITILMSGVWHAVERRTALEKLAYERNKYLQTLVSIGDGVMVVNREGNIEMLNKVAECLTGWTAEEACGRPYADVFQLSHEHAQSVMKDPIRDVLATDSVQMLGNHAVLTSKDGVKYDLEDSAAPIKDDEGKTVGVVLVFRDATEKKVQRNKIEYLSYHDALTGLYNRRFFEVELSRLDTERNLPISIVMCDANGLKLTNDIFGHGSGDLLLQRLAEVLKRNCRADDLIARWGGDEFVILLPKTSLEEAEQISKRIKTQFSQEHIKAIKGSVSIGCGVKDASSDNPLQALERAEERMYADKTLQQDEIRSATIGEVIRTLHQNNVREAEHSQYVSELCQALGKRMSLSEGDVRKLKEAGFLHDIGKIVLDKRLINKNHQLTEQEWNEVKKHPLVGFRILNAFDDTLDIAEAVLNHHERWNGSGHPKGLKEQEIPLLARMIAVVESYDRMIHDSDNIMAMTKEEALKIIRKNGGVLFDPVVAEEFCRMMENQDIPLK